MKDYLFLLIILIISFIFLFMIIHVDLFSRQGSRLDLTSRSYSRKRGTDEWDILNIFGNDSYLPSDKRRRYELKTFN